MGFAIGDEALVPRPTSLFLAIGSVGSDALPQAHGPGRGWTWHLPIVKMEGTKGTLPVEKCRKLVTFKESGGDSDVSHCDRFLNCAANLEGPGGPAVRNGGAFLASES